MPVDSRPTDLWQTSAHTRLYGGRLLNMYPSRLIWACYTERCLKNRLCGRKVYTPPWIFNGKRRMMAHFKEKEPCITVTFELFCNFLLDFFLNRCKKSQNCPNLYFFLLKFDLSFLNTKSKLEKNSMLRGKATLLLWNEP